METTFADSLCCHRLQLETYLEAWSREQTAILSGALENISLCLNPSADVAHAAAPAASPLLAVDDVFTTAVDLIGDEVPLQSGDGIGGEDIKNSELKNSPAIFGLDTAKQKSKIRSVCLDLSTNDAHSSATAAPLLVVDDAFRASDLIGDAAPLQSGDGIGGKGLLRSASPPENAIKLKNQAAILGLSSKTAGCKDTSKKAMVPATMQDSANSIQRLVVSRPFETICAIMIMANAVLIGFASDHAFRHIKNPDTIFFTFLEISFSCFYVLEIGLRISAYQRMFFCGEDVKWNLFDLVLVISSIFDQVESVLSLSGVAVLSMSGTNFSVLRVMRLMKMLKLLRVIRLMRVFRELRLVLNLILGSMQSMLWAVILIISTSYMFGIAILQGCTAYLQSGEPDADTVASIQEFWSSVSHAMLSLFMASTGGDSWRYMAQPLAEVGVLFYGIFLLYLAFYLFVLTNTLTSLFVENTMAHAEKDHNQIIQMEMDKKDQYIEKLRTFYAFIDTNGDGEVHYEEFCEHRNSSALHAFAASLEIDTLDAQQFFHVLSAAGTQPVDLETFVVGCIRLKGQAKSMDLIDLKFSHKKAAANQVVFEAYVRERLQRLQTLMEHADLAMSERDSARTKPQSKLEL